MTIAAPSPDQIVLQPVGFLAQVWMRWVLDVSSVLGGRQPRKVAEYTVATLPDAAKWKRHEIYVTDEAGGEVLAISDGTVWRRQTDRAVVS
jgi:hypothetical protein